MLAVQFCFAFLPEGLVPRLSAGQVRPAIFFECIKESNKMVT